MRTGDTAVRSAKETRREGISIKIDKFKPRTENNWLWCENCDKWFAVKIGSELPKSCPHCKSPIFKMRCTRCDHIWTLRARAIPKVCPKCASPYFARSRVMKRKGVQEDGKA